MNEAEAVAALDARSNYERDGRLVAPTLDRMRALADLLANPEKQTPAIHITGTNGKTTCAWAATQVLRAAGVSVGTYISPHLVSVRERLAYDGAPIAPDQFAEIYAYLDPFLREIDSRGERVTWFEAVTMMALLWFADRAAESAVIEVGMGGTWDATNIVDGKTAVITDVALDHPELGSTTVEVAREKGGIIKDGVVALTAARDPGVLAVLEARGRDTGSVVYTPGQAFSIEARDPAVGGQRIAFRLGGRFYEDLFLPLFGERIATDVVLGAAAAWAFLGEPEFGPDVLSEAFGSIRAPGRIEVARRRPLVVLDGAHNPAAAAALAAAVRESFRWDRLILVLGMLANKDAAGVIGALAPIVDDVLIARPASPRAADPAVLEEIAAAEGMRARRISTVAGALGAALEQASDSDCVLVSGSLYTVGEAKVALAHTLGETQ